MVSTDTSRWASTRIFISYRREETAYAAGWLFDRLTERFGRDQVFKDIDCIEPGQDFVDEITRAVGSCDVLLALIGSRWLTARDDTDRRRLDCPDDYVRLEIEAALTREVHIIPVLVDGASMPAVEELPTSLGQLVRRHALELSPARFSSDSSKLLEVVDRVLTQVPVGPSHSGRAERGSSTGPQRHQRRSALVRFGAPLAIVIGLVVVIALWPTHGKDASHLPQSKPSELPQSQPSGLPQSKPLPADDLVVSIGVDGPARLYRVSSMGTWTRNPLIEAGGTHGAVLSPDGKTIIYLSGTISSTPRVMAADGEHDRALFRRPVSGCGDVNRVAWSGSQPSILALVCGGPDGFSKIALVRIDGKLVRWLPTGKTYVDHPTFSPDGVNIAYWANNQIPTRTGALFTIATSGRGRPRPLTYGLGDFDPAWSPLGDQIAFSRLTSRPGEERHSEIYLVSTDRSGGTTPLVKRSGMNVKPAWSPTGNQLVFVNAQPGGTRGAGTDVLWLVDTHGGGPQSLGIGATTIDIGSWGLGAQ